MASIFQDPDLREVSIDRVLVLALLIQYTTVSSWTSQKKNPKHSEDITRESVVVCRFVPLHSRFCVTWGGCRVQKIYANESPGFMLKIHILAQLIRSGA